MRTENRENVEVARNNIKVDLGKNYQALEEKLIAAYNYMQSIKQTHYSPITKPNGFVEDCFTIIKEVVDNNLKNARASKHVADNAMQKLHACDLSIPRQFLSPIKTLIADRVDMLRKLIYT